MTDVVTKAVRRWQRLEAAREAVRPAVGDVPMSLDSANAVYAEALKRLGVSNADELGQHPRAAKAVYEALGGRPVPQTRQARMAADSAAAPRLKEMFPHANRLLP